MCGPLAAAGIGLAGSVISGIAAARQMKNASEQEKLAAEHQARQYLRNARYQATDYRRQAETQARNFLDQAAVHERQAKLERVKGSYDSARMTEKGRQLIGGQIASYAASGIALSGTIADVVHQTGESIALDISAARLGARIAIENESVLTKINRRNARLALEYGRDAASDAMKYGREAAKDARTYGATASASARSAVGLAFITPVISGVGTFLSSGAFN